MQRFIHFFIQILSFLSLVWGGLWSLVFLISFKLEATHITLLVILGLIPTLFGYLVLKHIVSLKGVQPSKLPEDNKIKNSPEYLHGVFFKILEQKNGYIDEVNFAMTARISGNKAHKFLQEKAREFNAKFIVTEDGDTAYKFEYITDSEILKIKAGEANSLEIGYGKTVLRKSKTDSPIINNVN